MSTVGLLPGTVIWPRVMNYSTHNPGGKATRFSGWAAVALLHLLELLPATLVIVAVNVCVVCTIAVPVAVIVIVM